MPSFEIVELDEKGKPRPFPAGVFPDGKSAASVLASLQAKFPNKKLQPRPLKDETSDWKARETRRFDEGIYQPLGWNLEPIKDHFAYRALKVKSNVAFTASDTEGKADKQRSVHCNAYLNQFYPQLSIEERRKLVWEYCGENVTEGLTITQDADEIEQVYRNGPRSCMSDTAESYATGGVHPTRAYAGPDLAVAYYRDVNDRNRITARCIVWPEKKIHSHGYGDTSKLYAALKADGYSVYSDHEDWYGARLTTHYVEDGWDEEDEEHYSGYVCPFLDICGYGYYDGTYLVLENYDTIRINHGRDSVLEVQSTCGLARSY